MALSKLVVLLLMVVALSHVGSCSEFCKMQSLKYCSGYLPYCCRSSSPFSTEYCCNDCDESVYASTRSSCYDGDVGVVVGAIIGVLIFIGCIVGLVVLCCLGFICTGLTGRSRRGRGRGVNPNATTGVSNPGVTVYTTTSAYPQQGYGQPAYPASGAQAAYPPATGGYQAQPYPTGAYGPPPPYSNVPK